MHSSLRTGGARLAAHRTLPAHAYGSALFADISGFTPLTEALARQLGQRRGAEVLTQQLNQVYSALISAVEAANGSVIGFSGDAITCWFDESETRGADRSEHQSDHQPGTTAWQRAPPWLAPLPCSAPWRTLPSLRCPAALRARLGLKTAIVTGAASRLLVGEPGIQLIDVLAGSTLDALADAEHSAQQGDVVVDAATLAALDKTTRVQEWRTSCSGQEAGSAGAAGRRPSPGSTARPPRPIRYWTTA